jgi:hypothetical protein
MATKPLTTENRGNVQSVLWANLTTDDYGQPWQRADYSDKTFQVKGDFGSTGNVALYGSNEATPVLTDDNDWFLLTDSTETALGTITAAGGGVILQNPRWIRPKVTLGTSPVLRVLIEATKGF